MSCFESSGAQAYLVDLLRRRHLRNQRLNEFSVYACFFQLGREEKQEPKLLRAKVHQGNVMEPQFPHMLRLMHRTNLRANL